MPVRHVDIQKDTEPLVDTPRKRKLEEMPIEIEQTSGEDNISEVRLIVMIGLQ